MFIIPVLTALCGVSAMESQEALHHYESYYESIHAPEEKSGQAFVWLSDIPHPLFNAVMHLNCEGDVAAKVDDLIAKRPEGPLSFWVHEQNRAEGLVGVLRERGFKPIISCPLMMWPVQPLEFSQADIRPADRKVFDWITSVAFQFDAEMQEKYSALLDQIDGEYYLVYIDGKPVSTGMLLPHGETGGIFNIGTLPEYEGRGCASAMMKHLQYRAYELGLKKLVLMSSPKAEKLYAGLGFKSVLLIDIYAR